MRGAIIDLDGTVYVGGQVVDGTHRGIEALRDAGLSLLYFSNNPVMDGDTYVSHLQEMGVDAREGEACSAGEVTALTLADRHPDASVLCIGAHGLCDQLRDVGLELTDDPNAADVLLASWSAEFKYEDMRRALVASGPDVPFYGTDPDRTFQVSSDELVPGSGAVIGAVAATVGREPDAIFGKPSIEAQRIAIDRLGVPPEECVIIGDRLDTDLQMGQQTGMTTVLVLSGVTSREDISQSTVTPDYVIEDIGEIERVLHESGC